MLRCGDSRRSAALVALIALVTLAASVVPLLRAAPAFAAGAAPGVHVSDHCVAGRPEPGTIKPVPICFTVFRPAGATAEHPVPMVMHSHGWGGSRATSVEEVQAFVDEGYGVLSFDQRGFGESGGKAHVENPRFEGKDVQRVIRYIAHRPWVQQDGPGDPRLGAVGGSYGGGYQFVGAFRNLQTRGTPVFDALAPQITWFDLKESLAPDEVTRSGWITLLTAAGVAGLPPQLVAATTWGLASGFWPDGSVPGVADMNAFFRRNGPKWHVRHGRRLDIPVLFGQGATDTLFPLRQGLRNWSRALTPGARRQSIFVGYNGGHVLPAVFPLSTESIGAPLAGGTVDPCSEQLAGGDFEALTLRFFAEKLRHRPGGLSGYGRIHLATAAGDRCTTVRSAAPSRRFPLGRMATPTLVGAPVVTEIADGPIRIAGDSFVTASVSSYGPNNRAFLGLAVGRSPLSAKVVQSNLYPINEPVPVRGVHRRVPLPSVAVDVPPGQHLYLVVTAASDTFALMGSRTPGALVLDRAQVHLPVVK